MCVCAPIDTLLILLLYFVHIQDAYESANAAPLTPTPTEIRGLNQAGLEYKPRAIITVSALNAASHAPDTPRHEVGSTTTLVSAHPHAAQITTFTLIFLAVILATYVGAFTCGQKRTLNTAGASVGHPPTNSFESTTVVDHAGPLHHVRVVESPDEDVCDDVDGHQEDPYKGAKRR
jgi:hypothetical protein